MSVPLRSRLTAMKRPLVALVAGGVYPLSFAPFELWWLGVVSIAVFYQVLHGSLRVNTAAAGSPDPKTTLLRLGVLGWCFGVGAFGVGASWIYVSINVYGGAPPLLAGLMVALFVAGIGWFFGLQGLLFAGVMLARGRAPISWVYAPVMFALLWPVTEWARGWILTGFPWLYAGYAHLETPLAGFAPVGGVLLVSFAVGVSATFLAHVVTAATTRERMFAGMAALTPWALALLLGAVAWVTPEGRPISVSAVQPNVDQAVKWDPDQIQNNVNLNEALTAPLWGRDLIVWSEASLTFLPEQGEAYLAGLDRRAREAGTALLVGIPRRGQEGEFYNSAMMMGAGNGNVYLKRHLVPFGEYVPLEGVLRGLIRFFDLPMSRNVPGPASQPPLGFAGGELSLSICYEIAYGELVRSAAADPAILVTISNDTWFGRSIGPLQHMQIARMRAVEMGRYLVRATNNGVSGVVDPDGRVIASAPQFESEVVSASVRRMRGRTPYARAGSWPLLAGLGCLIGAILLVTLRRDLHRISAVDAASDPHAGSPGP